MKIVVFGDVHGNLPALELMVDDAKKVDQYICLGDVVNYGPWSNECVQFIAEMENCIKIKGNHEDYFLRFMASGELGKAWMNNGGAALLNNFGLELSANSSPEEFVETASLLRRMLSPDHRCFLMGLQTYFEYREYYFVHAGIRPGVSLQNQKIQDMLWIRDDFMNSNIDFGKIIVHGHTIGDDPEIKANQN